jgi:four helix bundle protein
MLCVCENNLNINNFEIVSDFEFWISNLIVYRLVYQLALEIQNISRRFPKEEKYSLTDQIRRSSRSVAVNISEAWYHRKYPKSFVSKLIDCAGESGEAGVWLDFACDFNYIEIQTRDKLKTKYDEVNKMLNSMINNPDKFCR